MKNSDENMCGYICAFKADELNRVKKNFLLKEKRLSEHLQLEIKGSRSTIVLSLVVLFPHYSLAPQCIIYQESIMGDSLKISK